MASVGMRTLVHKRVTRFRCGEDWWLPRCGASKDYVETAFYWRDVTCKRCLRMLAGDRAREEARTGIWRDMRSFEGLTPVAHTEAGVRELVAGLVGALNKIGVKPLDIDDKQAYIWVEGIGGDRIEELPLASYLLLSWETERSAAAARAQAWLDAHPAEEGEGT